MDEMLNRILTCMGPTHGAGKALAEYLGVSPNVVTNWKNGSLRSYRKYIDRIAEFYHVSPQYLRGETDEKQDHAAAHGVTDEDIKFALFGGSGNITEEMYKEVLSFAAYVRQREEAKQTKQPIEEG